MPYCKSVASVSPDRSSNSGALATLPPAGVDLQFGEQVILIVGAKRLDDRLVVDNSRRVRQQLRNVGARLAVSSEFPGAAHQPRLLLLNLRELDALQERLGD